MTIHSPTGSARRGRHEGTGLRVLVTADSDTGARQYCLELGRGLSRLGHSTTVALFGGGATAGQAAAAAGVPGVRLVDTGLALDSGSDERELSEAASVLADLASADDADVVQLHAPALAGLADFGAPVVALHRGCPATRWDAVEGVALPGELAWRTAPIRAGLRAADAVVVPTFAHGAAVQRLYGLQAPPRTVHDGCSAPSLVNAAPHDFVFTSGRLWDSGENLGLLDAAAGRIGVPVRAAGPLAGPDGTPVLFDNLHCLGALGREERAAWLAVRPVFVSAALHDPGGRAILEAAAAGCPLILSDLPGFRELWDDVARFVPPRDEAGFTRAIAELVADDFERAVMGRAARERAGRYSADAMAAQMSAIYRSLLPALFRPVLAAARAA